MREHVKMKTTYWMGLEVTVLKKKPFTLVTKLFFIIRNGRLDLEETIFWLGSVKSEGEEINFYLSLSWSAKNRTLLDPVKQKGIGSKDMTWIQKRILATANGAGAGPSRPHQLQHPVNETSKLLMKTRSSPVHLHAPEWMPPCLVLVTAHGF